MDFRLCIRCKGIVKSEISISEKLSLDKQKNSKSASMKNLKNRGTNLLRLPCLRKTEELELDKLSRGTGLRKDEGRRRNRNRKGSCVGRKGLTGLASELPSIKF